uniref:Uncharacterized protein n=1 Tax=Arundo donax TaxID=35708 RepID=A0A0A8Y0Y6_ARUDO
MYSQFHIYFQQFVVSLICAYVEGG